ncbi:hypothetical protein D3C80_1609860 [compost metagenome]
MFTGAAVSAGVYHTTGAHQVAQFEFAYIFAHSDHSSYNLMSRYHREDTWKPVITDLVQIRVANPAVLYIELYIVRANGSSLKIPFG